MAPGLYIVATPIGNLRDITLRALDVLHGVDLIACEDTRITARLAQRYGLKAALTPYHDHNADSARPALLDKLAGGARIALVSDAGTPLISDPGYKLVRAARAAGHAVIALPGPSAALAALASAGLPTDRFLFLGFLPRGERRRTELQGVAQVQATLILYETGPRLADVLADAREMLGGGREAAIARELTKLYEEVRTGTLDDLATHYAAAHEPKGEIVVLIGPPVAAPPDSADVDAALRAALATMSLREAADAVAGATGLPRRQVYQRALALRGA